MISEYAARMMGMKLNTDMNKITVDEVNCEEQNHSELEPMSQLLNYQKRGFQEIDDDYCEMISKQESDLHVPPMTQNGTMDRLKQEFDTDEDFLPRSKRLKLDISPVCPYDEWIFYLDESFDRMINHRCSSISYNASGSGYLPVNDS